MVILNYIYLLIRPCCLILRTYEPSNLRLGPVIRFMPPGSVPLANLLTCRRWVAEQATVFSSNQQANYCAEIIPSRVTLRSGQIGSSEISVELGFTNDWLGQISCFINWSDIRLILTIWIFRLVPRLIFEKMYYSYNIIQEPVYWIFR